MPPPSPFRSRKTARPSERDNLRVDLWAAKLMHMVLGATMTQVALCRFLIEESVIDRRRLIAFLEKRGIQWSKTGSDEALLPLVTVLTRVQAGKEPDFPVEHLPAEFRPVRVPRRGRRTESQARAPRKVSVSGATAR